MGRSRSQNALLALLVVAACVLVADAMGMGGMGGMGGGSDKSCKKGNCESGYGVKEWNGGRGLVKYAGYFVNGQRHGTGIQYWPDGISRYEGEWRNDKMSGFGNAHLPNKQFYTGEWKNSERHGLGRFQRPGFLWGVLSLEGQFDKGQFAAEKPIGDVMKKSEYRAKGARGAAKHAEAQEKAVDMMAEAMGPDGKFDPKNIDFAKMMRGRGMGNMPGMPGMGGPPMGEEDEQPPPFMDVDTNNEM